MTQSNAGRNVPLTLRSHELDLTTVVHRGRDLRADTTQCRKVWKQHADYETNQKRLRRREPILGDGRKQTYNYRRSAGNEGLSFAGLYYKKGTNLPLRIS